MTSINATLSKIADIVSNHDNLTQLSKPYFYRVILSSSTHVTGLISNYPTELLAASRKSVLVHNHIEFHTNIHQSHTLLKMGSLEVVQNLLLPESETGGFQDFRVISDSSENFL